MGNQNSSLDSSADPVWAAVPSRNRKVGAMHRVASRRRKAEQGKGQEASQVLHTQTGRGQASFFLYGHANHAPHTVPGPGCYPWSSPSRAEVQLLPLRPVHSGKEKKIRAHCLNVPAWKRANRPQAAPLSSATPNSQGGHRGGDRSSGWVSHLHFHSEGTGIKQQPLKTQAEHFPTLPPLALCLANISSLKT